LFRRPEPEPEPVAQPQTPPAEDRGATGEPHDVQKEEAAPVAAAAEGKAQVNCIITATVALQVVRTHSDIEQAKSGKHIVFCISLRSCSVIKAFSNFEDANYFHSEECLT